MVVRWTISVCPSIPLRSCYIRDMIPGFLPQRLCMAAGYTGETSRIPNDDLLDCLRAKAYHKHKLDAISAEESLCSIARSVDPATNAADSGTIC